MGQLLVIGFNDKHKADEVMLDVLKQEQEHMSDLEDAVVVTQNARGKVRIKPYCDLLDSARGFKSEFWGSMISTLLENDDRDALSKIGLNREICLNIKEMMKPNTSVIFVLLRKFNLEPVKAEIEKYDGVVLYTTLSHAREEELIKLLP